MRKQKVSVRRILTLAACVAGLTLFFNNCSKVNSFETLSDAEMGMLEFSSVGSGGEFGSANPQLKYQCTQPESRGLGNKNLRRMTRPQIINTLTSLVGGDVVADSTIQTKLAQLSQDRIINSIQDIADAPPASQPTATIDLALRAAELVLADANRVKRVFGECAAVAMTDACMQTFLRDFGLRVYRRPVAADETASLMAQYKDAGGGTEGMFRVLARLLLVPQMHFHVELGSATEGNRIRLTDYEVASRLSYRLLNAPPDATLLAAAAAGQLRDVASLRAQAQRLLATPAGRVAIEDFFRYYMKLDSMPEPNAKAAKVAGVDARVFKSEMIQESIDFVNHVIWSQRGSLRTLFSSNQVFPRSSGMAKVLETTVAGGVGASITSSDHAGLLLRPAMMAGSGDLTNPYHRALIVRSNFLCETFGSPSAAAISGRQAELGDLSNMSQRDRLSALTNTPACLGCHGPLNPIAFTLEGYDQLGARRTVESVFDANGNIIKTYPINVSVSNPQLQDSQGSVSQLNGGADLQRALADGAALRSCFAQRVFEFQQSRVMDVATDSCSLNEVENSSGAQGNLQDVFVASVANTDLFYKALGN